MAAVDSYMVLCWSYDCEMGLFLVVEYDRPRDGAEALQFLNECWVEVLIAVPIVESESCCSGGNIKFCCNLT